VEQRLLRRLFYWNFGFADGLEGFAPDRSLYCIFFLQNANYYANVKKSMFAFTTTNRRPTCAFTSSLHTSYLHVRFGITVHTCPWYSPDLFFGPKNDERFS